MKPSVSALALLATVALLAACSKETQSLADYIAAICATPFRSSSPEEAPFLAESVSAMTKMMIDMGIRPSGNIDKDFAAMMISHHQGAIDMAIAELRYESNIQLRRLAQEIIVTQQQEIAAMHLALGEPLPYPVAARTQPQAMTALNPGSSSHHSASYDSIKVK